MLEGASKPFTLKQLVSPFAELKEVDTLIVLSERRIAIRKTGELGFRMYTSGLEMLNGSMANEVSERGEGYIAFRIGEEWGIADSIGNVTIKPRFNEIGLLGKDGNFWVRQETKWGLINKLGKWIEKPRGNRDGQMVAYMAPLSSDITVRKNNENQFVTFRFGTAPLKTENGWTLVDTNNNICKHQYFDSLSESYHGVHIYSMGVGEDRWMGLLIKDCEILVPGTYRIIDSFYGNYSVSSKDGTSFNYLNLEGDEVFLRKSFEKAEPAVGDYGVLLNSGKWEVKNLRDPLALPVYTSADRNSFRLVSLIMK